MNFSKLTIIGGHYGSGKTNFSVNLALDVAKSGHSCNVVDMDIVNPYFRTADFKGLFDSKGISLTAPIFANSNLDIPSLNYDLAGVIQQHDYTIIDVGGDDAGAMALGGYSSFIKNIPDFQFYYVVNKYRYLTSSPQQAVELMRDIEACARIKCTGIINNSNLGTETTYETVLSSMEYAEELSRLANIPIICTAINRKLEQNNIITPYPIDIHVKALWN